MQWWKRAAEASNAAFEDAARAKAERDAANAAVRDCPTFLDDLQKAQALHDARVRLNDARGRDTLAQFAAGGCCSLEESENAMRYASKRIKQLERPIVDANRRIPVAEGYSFDPFALTDFQRGVLTKMRTATEVSIQAERERAAVTTPEPVLNILDCAERWGLDSIEDTNVVRKLIVEENRTTQWSCDPITEAVVLDFEARMAFQGKTVNDLIVEHYEALDAEKDLASIE